MLEAGVPTGRGGESAGGGATEPVTEPVRVAAEDGAGRIEGEAC